MCVGERVGEGSVIGALAGEQVKLVQRNEKNKKSRQRELHKSSKIKRGAKSPSRE